MKFLKTILFFALLFTAQNSIACSCIELNESLSKKVTKSFNNNDLVVVGKVIAANNTLKTGEFQIVNNGIVSYIFEVQTVYKGAIKSKTISIETNSDGAACGYAFKVGQTYLVYANQARNLNYRTGLCSRNQELQSVKGKVLRKLKRLACKHKKAQG